MIIFELGTLTFHCAHPALGVLTLIEVHRNGVNDLSEPFLAAYMVLFAALLFVYELMWWQSIPGR